MLLFFVFSCKIDKSVEIIDIEKMSLKEDYAKSMFSINWTEQIEPNVLYTPKKENIKTSDKDTAILKPETIFLSNRNSLMPIYPFIENFGSLDTASLDPKSRNTLNTFLAALKEGNIQKNLFLPQSRYLSIVFSDFLETYPKPETWIFGESTSLSSETESFLEVPIIIFSRQNIEKVRYTLVFFIVQNDEEALIQQVQIGSLLHE